MADKIELVFYKTDAGGEPVRDWLRALPPAHRKLVGLDLMRAQFRWPIGMPLCRPLGSGLFEVRTPLPDHSHARVFICQSGAVLVALHSSIKKSRKAAPHDLKLARKRLTEVT